MRLRACFLTLISLFAIALFGAPGVAQTATVTLTASHLTNLAGQPVTGKLCVTPTNNSGSPIGFEFGSGGQGTQNTVCSPVTAGAMSMAVPDTAVTNPQNVCLRAQLFENSSFLTVNAVRTWSCLQPASSGQTVWCSTVSGVTSCNLDNFAPTVTPGTVLVTGPQGPAGATGAPGPAIVGLSSDGANGINVLGSVSPNTSIPKVSPMADIRANGAKIDGATDIGPALAASIAQCNASNGNACTVLLPCAGPNGCYLANGSSITWAPAGNQTLRLKLQGTLYLGSTFVMPADTSVTCDAGGGPAQFQNSGYTCAFSGKTSVRGTMGTAVTTTGSAVTFTPTYASGSASNFNVNSAISVAGLQTCSATASRTSAASGQNTVFTLSSCTDSSGNAEAGPRTPVGSTITVTGCSDSSFNVTGAVVNAQDWPNGLETIYESGATSTATGCTVTGYDDYTFENVRISAVSSGTFTATFAHKHAASDVWGMDTVAPLQGTFAHHEIVGASIGSMGGTALWLDNVAGVNLSDDAFSAYGGSGGIAAAALECDGCWWGTWNRDAFNTYGPSQHCISNCASSYPWGIRFSQDAVRNQGIGGAFIQISNSTIMGGVKVDGNGMANSAGTGPQIGPLQSDVFEQTMFGAVTVDPRFSLSGPVAVSMNFDELQDDFQNNTQYFVAGTDCCVIGFANIGDIPSFNSHQQGGNQGSIANKYWPNQVTARNVGNMENPGAVGNSTGLLTDGNSILGNFVGANAGMAPNIVPQATLAVTLKPTCATCITVTGPDGVANSATEIQTSSAGVHEGISLANQNFNTYAGDTIIFGAYCKPGTGETSWGSASGANWILDLYSFGTDKFLSNTASGGTGTSNISAAGAAIPLTGGTWQKCFGVAQIVLGESTAHAIRFQAESPGSGNSVGNDFYDPFWLYVPGPNNPSYAGVTQAEAVRWAEEMFKGYVPSGASTGILYANPNFKVSQGPTTVTSLNSTPFADQFAGADIGAKIRACAQYALANGIAECDATHFTGTQTTSTDMLTGLCAAGTASCNIRVDLGPVHIQSTVVQHITNTGVSLIGEGPMHTQIEYTGAAGAAAVLQIIDTANSVASVQVSGIFLYGDNGNVTDGLQNVAVHHSQFRDIYTWGVTGCGIHEEYGVTNTFDSPRTSNWQAIALGIFTGHSQPTSGICLDMNTVGTQTGSTSDDTIINSAAESLSGSGWLCTNAININILGGTSEANNRGLETSSSCYNVSDLDSDLEGNTTNDVLDNGTYTRLTSVEMMSTIAAALELGPTSHNASVYSDWVHSQKFDTGASGYTVCATGSCTFAGNITTPGYISTTAGYELNGTVVDAATPPVIASGFGTSPSIVQTNGTAAFSLVVGSGGTATSGVLTLPGAANVWFCTCNDRGTQSATVFECKQTVSTPTSATIANFNTSGAQAPWSAGDVLDVGCRAH